MKRLPPLSGVWLALVLLCGAGLPALATIRTVNSTNDDNGTGTLRYLIGIATSGDTINCAVTGTITLTNTLTSASGELVIDKDLTISGPVAGNLAVSGNGQRPVFKIVAGVSVNISDLTISGGSVRGTNGVAQNLSPGGDAQGGGFRNEGTLNLTNCVVSNNSAVGGNGGEGCNCVPPNVGGAGSGGGIANFGTLTLTGCILTNNSVTGGKGGDAPSISSTNTFPGYSGANGGTGNGGAIANLGMLMLVNCTIQNSHANGGLGGKSYGGPAAHGGGGGFGTGGAINNLDSLTLVNCTLKNNSVLGGTGGDAMGQSEFGGNGGSAIGGAIASHNVLAMTNCTVSTNSARGGEGGKLVFISSSYGGGGDASGGGIASSKQVQLTACTLGANAAFGGMAGDGIVSGDAKGGNLAVLDQGLPAKVRNSIIGHGTASGGSGTGPDVSGDVTSQGHNLVGNTVDSYGFGFNGDLLDMNPLLGPLQDNGGWTFTMALLAGSPALDAGDDALLTELTTDQRGGLRKAGAQVDIGAYEAGTFPVINNSDSGHGSLRQAILIAQPNDIILFAPSVTGTILLTSGELAITTNRVIVGPATGVTVSGNNASRVFEVYSNVTASFGNLTIRNGNVGGCPAMGGGVLNQGTLTLTNCTLWNNSVVGCDLSGATGAKGGSAGGGGAANLGTLRAINCTLATNSAIGGHGGNGITIVFPPLQTPNGNGGDASGGGLFNQGTLTMICCTLHGNSAMGGPSGTGGSGGVVGTGGGGGYYQASGSSDIFNTIFAGDAASTVGSDVSGVVGSSGWNLAANTSGSSGWISSDILGQDPLLGPLQDNGGPTVTMALLAGSPAIDKGNSGFVSVPHADQRGFTRPVDLPANANASGADGADIGAYEVQLSTIYRDIGLRLFDGTTTNKIAAEWPAVSALRIARNGTNYGIVLVATNSPDASKFRIQTASGTKSLMKLP